MLCWQNKGLVLSVKVTENVLSAEEVVDVMIVTVLATGTDNINTNAEVVVLVVAESALTVMGVENVKIVREEEPILHGDSLPISS